MSVEGRSEPEEPGARAFVGLAWAGSAAAALAFVLRYGPSFPRWDDFTILPALLGERPATLGWLWSPHNEHRIPLVRLVLLGLLKLSGGDFRAGMVFNVVALAAASAGMVVVVARVRGAWRASDAFFPMTLLHLGHSTDLLWSTEVQFVLSTALAGGLLLLIVADGGWPGPIRAAGAGTLLALMTLCGANGVAPVPALALWLAASSWASFARGRRRAGLANAAAALAGLGLVALYVATYPGAPQHGARPEVARALRTSLEFLSLTLGPSASALWPYSGIAVAAAIGSTAVLLARAAAVEPNERPRALGLLAYLGGVGSLALGIGWGRSETGAVGGFEPRYVTLAAPLGPAIYYTWSIYGPSTAWRRLVPLCLFATMLVLLWPNDREGLAEGRALASGAEALGREIRSGAPMYLVIRRATPFLHPSQDELATALPKLRQAGLGIFRNLRPDPPFREVAIPVEPATLRMARWDRGTAHVDGVDPLLTYVLPEEAYVAAIRLRYAHANPDGAPGRFKIDWRRAGQAAPGPDQRFSYWYLTTGEGREITIRLGEAIKEFRIQPDNRPCEFRVDSITLLEPAG